jgi:GTP1/Obg family GTP-binding protein
VAFWISLAVFVVGLLGGLAYAILRGLALWRNVKHTGRAFSTESARIADVSAGIQAHLDRAEASNELLREAAARLAASRARLDVQLHAVREARHALRRVLPFLPGV